MVPGPGSTVTGVVVGLILLALAALMVVDRLDLYDGPIASVLIGSGLVLIGLAIVLTGLRGRRAGGLTALAIIGIIIALPVVTTENERAWRWSSDHRVVASDSTLVVTDRSEARDGITVGLGDAVLDLTDVPLTGDTLHVPAEVGLGDLTVIVPADIPVSAEVRIGGGDAQWNVDDEQQSVSGVVAARTFTSDEMADGTQAQIALSVDVGLGSIYIEED